MRQRPPVRRLYDPFFRKNGVTLPKTFATHTNSGAALEGITSAGTRIGVSRTEPPYASRGSEYASAPQDLLNAIERSER